VPPLPPPRRSDDSYNSSASGGSYSSVSGSSSSFLNRMKGRGGYGYGSSRTSVEEESDPQSRGWKEVGQERSGWLRQRMADMTGREHGTSILQSYRPMTDRAGRCSCSISMSGETMDGDESLPGGPSDYGLRLWSRVATAASTLTISVSKAWASNIAAHPGESASFSSFKHRGFTNSIICNLGTPPGEESRLTRALKAYHIDKARDPTDLPEWLFEEHERRPIGRSGTSFRYREEEDNEYGEYEPRRATKSMQSRAGGGRGLRDVYDTAAAATRQQQETLRESSSRGWLPQRQDDGPVGAAAPTSKAHERLKALRDAKRQAAQRNTSVSSIDLSGRASLSDGLASREERGRSLGQERRQGDGPHRRAPSLPASVRPPHSSGLPPRPGIRRI
jgi:hypothetical protein